jgi:signal transduction histidine kinase
MRLGLKSVLLMVGMLLAPQARRQGVELKTTMPEASVLMVGHRDRLKQSFLNIAVNALEAMSQGGRMSLEMQIEGSRVRVAVLDTGRGIGTRVEVVLPILLRS